MQQSCTTTSGSFTLLRYRGPSVTQTRVIRLVRTIWTNGNSVFPIKLFVTGYYYYYYYYYFIKLSLVSSNGRNPMRMMGWEGRM